MTRSLLAQLAKVIAAGSFRQDYVGHGFAQGAVFYDELQVHLGLAFEFGDAASEGLAISADGLAEGFISIKNSAEFEWKHGCLAEAGADDAGVVENGALVEVTGPLIFADDDGEIATRVAVNRRSVHTFNIFNRERAAGSCLP